MPRAVKGALLLWICAWLASPSTDLASAQRRQFGRRGDGERSRDGERSSQSSSSQEMQSRLQRFDALLKQLDANGDGTIQPGEVPRDRKYIYESMARRAGLDPNGPIPVARFREATLQRYGQSSSSAGGSSSVAPGTLSRESSGTAGRSTAATVGGGTPGFGGGAKSGPPVIQGFGSSASSKPGESPGMSPPGEPRRVQLTSTQTTSAPVSAAASSSSLGQAGGDRGPGTTAGPPPSGTSTATANAASGPAGTAAPAPRKFYRALTPAERLPPGLPDWFARKDANGDGQVSMAEFSDTWNDQTAAEFSKYDLNNDGFIVPTECLEAMKAK